MSSRDAIIQAATAIFADKGFESTSVREICAAASVNLAAVNYHFGGKASLYREVVLLAYNATSSSQMPTLETHAGDAETALAAWIDWYVARSVRGGADPATRLLLREAAQPSEALSGVVESVIHPVYRGLERILAELLPAETEPRTLKLQCLAVIGQCLVHRVCREMIDRLPVEPPLGPDDAPAISTLVLANTRASLGLPVAATSEPAS